MTTPAPRWLLESDETLLPGHAAGAVFSRDRLYRYVMSRRWDDRPPLVWLMLNPSTADAFRLDPTTTRCRRRSQLTGYGGFVVLNLFAYRSPSPHVLRLVDDPVGPDNDEFLDPGGMLLGHGQLAGSPVVAAWGAHPAAAARGDAVTAALLAAGREVLCLGTTKDGHPKHPLLVPASQPLIPWPTATLGGAEAP